MLIGDVDLSCYESGRMPKGTRTMPQFYECRFCHKPLAAENSALCDGCPCNSPLGTNDGIPCATCGQPRRNGECECRRGGATSAGTLQRECAAAVAATGKLGDESDIPF